MTPSSATFDAHPSLRQATASAHARVDAIVGGGLRTVQDYAAYLRGMHRFVVASEAALADADLDLASRRQWLEVDLSTLRTPPLAAPLLPAAIRHPVARLGWEYVFAGAAIGARYLLRGAVALGFTSDHGARFLAGHANGDDWSRFRTRLQQAGLCEHDLARLCESAGAAFDVAETAFATAFDTRKSSNEALAATSHKPVAFNMAKQERLS